jgi:hypothetical protein
MLLSVRTLPIEPMANIPMENNLKTIRSYVVLPLHHSALLFLKQSINEADNNNLAEKRLGYTNTQIHLAVL